MRLKAIFKEQKSFLEKLINLKHLSEEDKRKYTKEYILSIHRELSEILDTFPWKLHRVQEVKETNTEEEIIDCFKFLLNLCILWKIDDNKFFAEFKRKSKIVRERYSKEIKSS